MHNLNTLEHSLKGDPRLAALAQCEKEAYDLILGDAGKARKILGWKPTVGFEALVKEMCDHDLAEESAAR